MKENRFMLNSEEDFKKAIIKEKERGVPDIDIGRKYGVSYKYIEKVITRHEGVNVSNIIKK